MAETWVGIVTAQTPINLAVLKYWGKRDETLILPVNDSISVTLDPALVCTTTTVAVSPTFDQDRMWLNGKEISLSGGRYQNCLREIRARACDVEDKEKVIKITKKDWDKLHVHIASFNNFTTAAGLASSAAGFTCLVFALAKLMNAKEDNSELSAIARLRMEATALLFNLLMRSIGMIFLSLLLCYVLGDKTILKDTGIEEMKDVESLLPPPELKDAQRYKGDFSYFICTKPGRSPVLFPDASHAFLNPKIGLPK